MTLLERFVGSPFAAAIGWSLLHSLWEGALVSALLAAVLVAVRSPRARYAAACAAMLLMLGGFSLTFMLLVPRTAHSLHSLKPLAIPPWNLLPANGAAVSWSPGLVAIAPWLAPLWISGVLLLYIRNLAGSLSVQRLRHRGVCCAQDRWQKELARLAVQLRVSRTVLLLESSLADVPMVLGHFKPLILVPVGLLAGVPQSQVEAILLHELAHIRRYDYLTNMLQRLVEGLLFYHPAVWWISHVLRAERENCCDDVVVSITGNAHEYARTLAALEQFRFPGREPAIALTGGRLMKRIRRLLYSRRSQWCLGARARHRHFYRGRRSISRRVASASLSPCFFFRSGGCKKLSRICLFQMAQRRRRIHHRRCRARRLPNPHRQRRTRQIHRAVLGAP
jgi:bla regulator protein BlaR1